MAHILLVENDAKTREALGAALSAHDVRQAEDGEAALSMIRDHKPDMVLTEIMLPKKHGWAVIQAIRSNPATKDIPIVAMTEHVMVATRESAMELGCDDYLPKPINAEAFQDWFSQFLLAKGLS